MEYSVTTFDHRSICQLGLKKDSEGKLQRSSRKYYIRRAEWSLFIEEVQCWLAARGQTSDWNRRIERKEDLADAVTNYTQAMEGACTKIIILVRPQKRRKSFPRWSDELKQQRRDVNTKRRRIKCAAPQWRQFVVDDYLIAKFEYEDNVVNAQTQNCVEYCTKQEGESMRDGNYRLLRKKSHRSEDQLLIEGDVALSPDQSVARLAIIL